MIGEAEARVLWSDVKVELKEVDEAGLIQPFSRVSSARGSLGVGVGLGPGVA